MHFKAVIFDLDGTLLDTLKDIAISANIVLSNNGLPTHPEDDYRTFVGAGATELMARALPEGLRVSETLEKYVEAFRHEYGLNWKVHTRVYPGIANLLDELVARQVDLAILSNKPHDFVRVFVVELLSSWKFSVVLGYHGEIPPKPDPAGAQLIASEMNIAPSNMIYLGDSDIDMQTAVAAGMFPVGVLWGFRTRQELEANGAQMIITQPQDVLTLFKGN